MDVAGLVLGAVVLIKPVCEAIHDTLANYRGFGHDAERLRLRFAVQRARLESLERVLFDDSKFRPAMPGRLIDHLPRRMCDDMLGLLRQLYELLLEYAAVRAQYFAGNDAKDDPPKEEAVWPELANLDPADRMKALVLEGKKSDTARQKAAGWARKVMWVAMDRSSTERLVDEFERWTGQAQALLEAAWWPLSFFETIERMRTLEADDDARQVGLLRGIDVRKVLAAPLTMIPRESLPLEHAALDFRATAKVHELGSPSSSAAISVFELGELRQEQLRIGALSAPARDANAVTAHCSCLVEYRYYDLQGTRNAEAVRQMVVKFAALLHVGPLSDEALRLLPQCIGFFQDAQNSRFGLAYSIPPAPSSSPNPVTTLAALLDAGAKRHTKSTASSRPSLCARVRLARELAVCVQRLHAYKWVHKSLSSDNVLFLSPSSSLDNPRIVGFRYARQEADESDRILDDETRRNIYRHPDRWGPSPARFEKVHDIYGGYSLPTPVIIRRMVDEY